MQKLHVMILMCYYVQHMNVMRINSTIKSSPQVKPSRSKPDYTYSYLSESEGVYTIKLIDNWTQYLRTITGLTENTINLHLSSIERLLRSSNVPPWKLKQKHIIAFLDIKTNPEKTTEPISPATQSSYFSGWRSIQTYMLSLDVTNEIVAKFGIKPEKFVGDENSLLVKKYKANQQPKGWALTDGQIDAVDKEFKTQILSAHKANNQKKYLALCRDRIMFHVCIHYALRVSELINIQLSDFSKSNDSRLADFSNYALLTVTGKNNVTGTVPTRSKEVYDLIQWYINNIRPKIIRGKVDAKEELTNENSLRLKLLFPSERKTGAMCANNFRKRLSEMGLKAGIVDKSLHPHILRHTGCTQMVPVYSPESAQKYMRHKNLATTLHYYHPSVLEAGNSENIELDIFDDED